MKTKQYLFATKHPTSWLVFSTGTWENKLWGFRAGWPDGRFILKQLIATYGKEDGVKIYNAYNQALLDVKDSGMAGIDNNTGKPKKVWCIVLYQETNSDDNKVSLDEQWSESAH